MLGLFCVAWPGLLTAGDGLRKLGLCWLQVELLDGFHTLLFLGLLQHDHLLHNQVILLTWRGTKMVSECEHHSARCVQWHVCVFVPMYVYVCVYMCIHMHVCVCVCVCVCACVCVCFIQWSWLWRTKNKYFTFLYRTGKKEKKTTTTQKQIINLNKKVDKVPNHKLCVLSIESFKFHTLLYITSHSKQTFALLNPLWLNYPTPITEQFTVLYNTLQFNSCNVQSFVIKQLCTAQHLVNKQFVVLYNSL